MLSLAHLSVRCLFCAIALAGPAHWAHAQTAALRQDFERGNAAMRNGQATAAEQAFRDAVRLAPNLAEAHLDLGLVLAREGRLDEAVDQERKAADLAPKQPAAHMFLGIFLFQGNHLDAARQALGAELAIDPRSAEALVWLGRVETSAGHPERAAAAFDRAADVTPNDPDLLELRGRAHSQVARDSYAQMARLDPNGWHIHKVQALLFSDDGKHADAIAEYQAAIKLAPQNPDLYEGLGDEYRASAQLDAAQEAYRHELELAPANPVALYNVGSVAVDRGDSVQGVPLLLKMVKIFPNSPVAAYFLGRGLASLGQDEEAVAWLRQSAAADPEGEIGKRSWYELTRVERKLHHNAEAQTALDNYNRLRQAQDAKNTQQIQDWKKLSQ